MTFNQTSFSGGMNLILDDTRIGPSEYRIAFNVRCRFDVLKPIKGYSVAADFSGKKQGIMTVDDYIVLFCDGRAFYRHRLQTDWNVVSTFMMSPSVDRYWFALVPFMYNYSTRIAVGDQEVPTDVVELKNPPPFKEYNQALVVQDGVNKPSLIYIDQSNNVMCRTLSGYDEWTTQTKEYVPIGKQMLYHDGILYIASTDGRLIYRSVTGRPLDFMVNINSDGKAGGDASTVAYSVGPGVITCLSSLQNGIFVSTKNPPASYLVVPNRQIKKFGEPTFDKFFLFQTSPINDISLVDILGDTAFIEPEGIRSFNSISNQTNEGRNSVISLSVSPLFSSLQTDTTCAVVFDNYALFSVATKYGPAILVFDTLIKKFVSIDFLGVHVKQFAKIDTDVVELYAITHDDRVIKLYDQNERYEKAIVITRSVCTNVPSVSLRANELRIVFSDVKEDGYCKVIQSTDEQRPMVIDRASVQMKRINKSSSGVAYNDFFPLYFSRGRTIRNLLFNFTEGSLGWKHSYTVEWNNGYTLTNLQVVCIDEPMKNPTYSQ